MGESFYYRVGFLSDPTGRPSLRKILVILWSSRSEMNGILKCNQSVFKVCGSWFWGRLALSMTLSGYPLMRRMSSNVRSCLFRLGGAISAVSRLRSLRMKLIFEFLVRADWWCKSIGFLAVFCLFFVRAFAVLRDCNSEVKEIERGLLVRRRGFKSQISAY